MPLIEIDVPESDTWEDSLAARILLIVTALLLMRMGFRVWASLMPENYVGAVVTLLLFAVACQLLVFSVSDIDFQKWAPRMAYAVLGVLLLGLLASLWRFLLDKIQTDSLLFSRAAVEGLANGRNPYQMDMTPWIRSWKGPQFATPRINGEVVDSLSYPAGSVLWFFPQYALVGETRWGIRLTPLLASVALCGVLIASVPRALAMAPVAVMLSARNQFVVAAGGVFDVLWVLPVVLGMLAWYHERWLLAAAAIGLACGTKQTPWALLPFLLVWLIKAGEARRIPRMTAVGGAAFLLLNGPFILWDSTAWLEGVLTPLSPGAPLVHQGVGLAIIPFVGLVPLPTWWYALAVLSALAVSLTAYWLYWEELKWAAWTMPAVLYLFHSRSLMSYFTAFAPIALLAAVAMWGRIRTPAVLEAESPVPERREAVGDD